MCGLPKVSQLVSGAIRAGTGFPMHVLFTAGEVSFFQFLLLGKLSKVKVAHSRSEGQSSRTGNASQQTTKS